MARALVVAILLAACATFAALAPDEPGRAPAPPEPEATVVAGPEADGVASPSATTSRSPAIVDPTTEAASSAPLPRPAPASAAPIAAPQAPLPIAVTRDGEPRRVTVEGTVVDAEDRPVAGARVEATGVEADSDSEETDGAGRFRLAVPMYGPIGGHLFVSARGFCRGLVVPVRADDGETVLQLDPIRLARGGALRGLVTGPGGPAPGAKVFLSLERDRYHRPLGYVVDEEGRFALEALDAGSYVLEATDGDLRTLPARVRVEVGQTIELDVRLHALRTVEVAVRTADGAPAVGTAELLAGDLRVARGAPLLAPVDVAVEARVLSGALVGRADVPPGATRVEVTLEPSRRLTGRVVRSGQGQGARLTLYYYPDRRGRADDGVARVELDETTDTFQLDVPAGLGGQLHVVSHGEGPGALQAVAAEEQQLVVRLPESGRLTWAGDPAAEPCVAPADARFERLRGQRLAAGWVDLLAFRHDLGLAAAARVEVLAGVTAPVTVALLPALRVRGRAVDPRGRPVQVGLSVERTGSRSRKDGRFEVALPPGRWRFAVTGSLTFELDRPGRPARERPLRTIEVTGPGDLDLGDLMSPVE